MTALARMLVVSAPATMFELTQVGTKLRHVRKFMHISGGFDQGTLTGEEGCYPWLFPSKNTRGSPFA